VTGGWLYLLDVAVTLAVVQPLTVLVWASLWTITDLLLLPSSPPLHSYLASLALGYAGAAALFAAQSRVHALAVAAARHGWVMELAVEDAYKMAAAVATLLLWRGWVEINFKCWRNCVEMFRVSFAVDCTTCMIGRLKYVFIDLLLYLSINEQMLACRWMNKKRNLKAPDIYSTKLLVYQ
jgi:hypothetical protein